jgi:DNA-binding transcriptional MerR regulator
VEAVSKGPDAFRTISEVAAELDLPQHVLRFWETRFAQIRPMKRGGGRRYYRPDDIDLLRGIRHLLYGEGYTIRGVQRILKEQGPRFVIAAGRGGRSAASDDGGDLVHATAAADEEFEPTFDPRGFRSGGGNGSGETEAALSQDEVRRLKTTLSELLELKRLLDQSR